MNTRFVDKMSISFFAVSQNRFMTDRTAFRVRVPRTPFPVHWKHCTRMYVRFKQVFFTCTVRCTTAAGNTARRETAAACAGRRGRLRLLGRETAGRRQDGDVHAAQARDDMGGGQPQRPVQDVEHVRLQGELQSADDADGQLGRELVLVAGAPVPDQQQLHDNAHREPGVAGYGRRRLGPQRLRRR